MSFGYPMAYRGGCGGGESPRTALPKGAAFGRMKKKNENKKLIKNQEREKQRDNNNFFTSST